MKRSFIIILLLLPLFLKAQKPTAAYVKELYKKFPTVKSNLCPACLLWVNPYFKSIGDTLNHKPVLTYYIYTKAHRLAQEALKLPRTGAYASWHSAYKQPNETAVYKEANRIIGKPNSAEMIAKGHCQAWMAWSSDAALLSNTYTFNAGMEYQGQNIGVELATEELCRKLTGYRAATATDTVRIWCGTYGTKKKFLKSGISVTVPSHYYKVIRYRARNIGSDIIMTFWMPNDPMEKRSRMNSRMITYEKLVKNIGFDPQKSLTD
jgi:hypothetical protein